MASPGNDESASLEEAYRRALKEFLPRPEVTGVDIGYKYENGGRTDVLAVRVHVRAKEYVDPTRKKLEVDFSVPVDVLVSVSSQEAKSRVEDIRPVQPGVSVGSENGSYGTLGLFVRDNNNNVGLITAWHVLDGSSGKEVFQPAPEDLEGNFEIAKLVRFAGSPVDAALALKSSGDKWDPLQFEKEVVVSGVGRAVQGNPVKKSSRSTGVTEGVVEGVGIYKLEGGLEIDGFVIGPVKPGNPDNVEISSDGDSGAVWYHADTKEGLGLHLAGEKEPEPEKEHAIASHLKLVFEKLEIKEIYKP